MKGKIRVGEGIIWNNLGFMNSRKFIRAAFSAVRIFFFLFFTTNTSIFISRISFDSFDLYAYILIYDAE